MPGIHRTDVTPRARPPLVHLTMLALRAVIRPEERLCGYDHLLIDRLACTGERGTTSAAIGAAGRAGREVLHDALAGVTCLECIMLLEELEVLGLRISFS